MCYEDIKLGIRRRAKITSHAGGVLKFPGDSTRVVLKVSCVTGSIRGGPLNGNQGVLVADSATVPTDQITLETHGTIVQSDFSFDGGAGIISIIEILDPMLSETPK
jgi:hypothetical protein